MRTLICCLIKLYRYWISPWLKPSCRFYPSCSEYALLAISEFGLGKGLVFTFYRLGRCHPWSHGGYDPVTPPKKRSVDGN